MLVPEEHKSRPKGAFPFSGHVSHQGHLGLVKPLEQRLGQPLSRARRYACCVGYPYHHEQATKSISSEKPCQENHSLMRRE